MKLLESIEVQENLYFIPVGRNDALSDILNSSNKDAINKSVGDIGGFYDSSHYRIYYKSSYIGNIAFTPFHKLIFSKNEKSNEIYLLTLLNLAGISKDYIKRTLYITYLEIINEERKKLNISSVDILYSIFASIKDMYKNYMYLTCIAKNERLTKFYMYGGFTCNNNYIKYKQKYKKIYHLSNDNEPLLRYDVSEDSTIKSLNMLELLYNQLFNDEINENMKHKQLYENIMVSIKNALNEAFAEDIINLPDEGYVPYIEIGSGKKKKIQPVNIYDVEHASFNYDIDTYKGYNTFTKVGKYYIEASARIYNYTNLTKSSHFNWIETYYDEQEIYDILNSNIRESLSDDDIESLQYDFPKAFNKYAKIILDELNRQVQEQISEIKIMEVSELKDYLYNLTGISPSDKIDTTKYVIAEDNNTDESFFIGFSNMYGSKIPNFTSIKNNNFKRMRLFKSKEDAELTLNMFSKYYKNAIIITYDDAIKLIGDADARHNEYKENIEQERFNRLKDRAEKNKEKIFLQNATDKEYNPGKYKVEFKINGNYWDRISFIVIADSRQDAYEKAKDKALKLNPNYGNNSYDGHLTFNKEFIEKQD